MVSINSPSGQYIYSAAAHMSKSESYRAPGNKNQVAMFFKTPNEKIHSERKRIWSGLFTKDGYVPFISYLCNGSSYLWNPPGILNSFPFWRSEHMTCSGAWNGDKQKANMDISTLQNALLTGPTTSW